MTVLLSHTHSIVCALAYFEPKNKFKKEIKSIKEILCNFLVRMLQYVSKKIDPFFAHEKLKKETSSNVAHNS